MRGIFPDTLESYERQKFTLRFDYERSQLACLPLRVGVAQLFAILQLSAPPARLGSPPGQRCRQKGRGAVEAIREGMWCGLANSHCRLHQAAGVCCSQFFV